MGLSEDQREYYLEQERIERAIKQGKIIECVCGRLSAPHFAASDARREFPRCERCVAGLEEELEDV